MLEISELAVGKGPREEEEEEEGLCNTAHLLICDLDNEKFSQGEYSLH